MIFVLSVLICIRLRSHQAWQSSIMSCSSWALLAMRTRSSTYRIAPIQLRSPVDLISGKFNLRNFARSSLISSAEKIPKSVGERRLPSGRPQPIGSSLLAGMRECKTRMRTRLEFSRRRFHIFPLMLLSLRMSATWQVAFCGHWGRLLCIQ